MVNKKAYRILIDSSSENMSLIDRLDYVVLKYSNNKYNVKIDNKATVDSTILRGSTFFINESADFMCALELITDYINQLNIQRSLSQM